MPVSYKIVHEIRAHETEPKLRDLVERLRGYVNFDGHRVLYSWIGGTRRDWRGQGHFRALTEESEAWAIAAGLPPDRREDQEPLLRHARGAGAAAVQRGQVRAERADGAESRVYLAKPLPAELVRDHRSVRTVVHAV